MATNYSTIEYLLLITFFFYNLSQSYFTKFEIKQLSFCNPFKYILSIKFQLSLTSTMDLLFAINAVSYSMAILFGFCAIASN